MATPKKARAKAASKRAKKAHEPASKGAPKMAAKKASPPRKGAARKAKSPNRPKRAAARAHQSRRAPETLRLHSFTPSLTVSDLRKSLAFYTEALGFFVGESWTSGDLLRGVMLKAGACELGLTQDDWKQGRDRKKGVGFRIWCDTAQDVDALAARVTAAGFALTEKPEDHPDWGVRSFAVDDPDGFHLTIARDL
jgi:catechol 2,3-dioxygenase-like lactoylglutathione lyase family enzyme